MIIETTQKGIREPRDEHIRSLARGLSVLKAFREGREKLTIADVARACDMTRAGARRILLTLQRLGYLNAEGRRFYVTARVLDLGRGFRAQNVWSITRPELETVAESLDETVSAGVLDNFNLVYALRIRAERIIHLDLEEGTHISAHLSSMGRVLLAALPASEFEWYLQRREFPRHTPFTITEPGALREELAKVQRNGYCIARDELIDGRSCIAVPLVGEKGKTIAALNVSSNSRDATDQRIHESIIPLLRDAAERISDKI